MAKENEDAAPTRSARARTQALETAASLFYAEGVRAEGMEQIVERSGIAKTTIYRHFPTKDHLIEAYLEKEDEEFWRQWDDVIAGAAPGRAQLDALCRWIGDRVVRKNYRGCPQINVAAEFSDRSHPARKVARRHKTEMHRRLQLICKEIRGIDDPDLLAMQLSLLFDGAFSSDGRLSGYDAPDLLKRAVARLTG